MSFGFSIGDFLAVIDLANKVRKDFASAPEQFQQITNEIRNLTIVFQDVDDFLANNDLPGTKENDLYEITNNCRRVLEDLQSVIDKTSSLEKEGSVRKRAKRVWKRLKWDPDEVRDLRNRITSNITVLNAFTTSYTRDNIVKLVVRQEHQKHQEIIDWLTPIDTAAQQTDFIRRRQPGTGQWLIESPEYCKWKTAKGEVLFCHGIPGAGKTILSSIVVDDLQECHAAEDVAVCYFYCNFQRQDEQRLENIVLSFLKQLAQVAATTPDCLKVLFDKHQIKQSRPSLEEISSTLYDMAGLFARIFIVIDALDECQTMDGQQRQLISQLMDLRTTTKTNILATSRPVPHIVEKFDNAVSVEVLASPEDVQEYIEGNIQNLPGFVRRSPDLLKEVSDRIVEVTEGMFLLAKLHLDSLKGKRSPRELRKTLNTLTKGNDAYTEAYSNTMLRICGQLADQKKLAIQALIWIVHAKRPLSKIELQHALGVEVGEIEFFDDNIPDLQDIVSACCGLVTVSEASGIVRLVHYTTQEFFEGQGASYLPNAHAEIANTCVTYLSFDNFASGPCQQEEDFKLRLDQFPLYEYASNFWGCHAKDLEEAEVVQYFLGLPTQVEGSSQALLTNINQPWESLEDAPFQVTGLHLAAYYGLAESLVRTILHKYNVDAQDSEHRTPLSWVAENGHEAMARLLLDKNAQVDTADTGGRTPLSYAASNGYEAVVCLLLDKHAQVDTADSRGRTPLLYATSNGHEAIVRLLLSKNAQVDTIDIDSRTPLSSAIANGHEAIGCLLLDKNAQADTVDYSNRTPLLYAASNGHDTIVRLLLGKNAQADTADVYSWTPLLYAVSNGYEIIVRLLLDNNAQVDIADSGGRTPLLYAASNGYEAVVRLLLDKHAQVDIADSRGRTPLSYAASNGHEAVVRLLLDKNAQIDAADQSGQTPLLWAVKNGHETVVHLLVDKNAQVTTADNSGWTPLSWAASNGYEVMLCLLLHKNSQVDTADVYSWTPLLWAAENGHEAVVRLLLDRNAQVDTADQSGQTPLLWAAKNNHDTVVRLLLDKNAHVDIADNNGQTPLLWAAENGHEAVVRLLLNKNTDIDTADNNGWTPLSWAASNGHEVVVCLLLDENAQVDTADYGGRTPLLWAAENGHEAVVRLLLNKNAQVDIVDKDGWTPLSWAASNGHEVVVRLLLDKNAQVDIADNDGRTPLSWAAGYGNERIVEVLLDHGAAIDSKDIVYSRTSLIWAAHEGQSDVIRVLLTAGANYRATDVYKRSALIYLLRTERADVLTSFFAEHQLDVNIVDHWGSAASSFAARFGRFDVFRQIAALSKVDVNLPDSLARTSLWWAQKQGHYNLANYLLERNRCSGVYVSETQMSIGQPVFFGNDDDDEECTVCLCNLRGSYYHCDICVRGSIDICQECYGLGARCFMDSHLLLVLEVQDQIQPFPSNLTKGSPASLGV